MPEPRADEVFHLAARGVSDLEIALIGVQRAEAANDLHMWTVKRQALDVEIRQAAKVIERAERTADRSMGQELAALRTRYEAAVSQASAHVTAPRGFEPSRLEDDLLRAVSAPGPGKRGMEEKEAAIRWLLDQLTPLESRQLVARVKRPASEDMLATAFRKVSNLGTERLERLMAFAKDAPRRAALRAEPLHSLEVTSASTRKP